MDDPDDARMRARFLPVITAELAALEAASGATGAARRPVELDQQSVGRLSRMDALQNQAMAQGEERRRTARRTALRAALRRLEDGEFGWCDGCGETIAEKRLALDPTVTRCIDCAR